MVKFRSSSTSAQVRFYNMVHSLTVVFFK